MGVYGIYIKLEIKRAFKILPRFLAGAIVLVCLLGTIAFLASRVLYGDSAVNRITMAVVLPEEDLLAQKAVLMLASMDSVESLCDFVYVDEDTAIEQLKNREVHGIMKVPKEFINGIITGVNTPILIILPDEKEIESLVFKELADAGARSLGIAQASIYAADEICYNYGLSEVIPKVEKQLNNLYFAYTLPRLDYFRHYQVNAISEVTAFEFFSISGIVFCLFLSGIPLYSLCKAEKRVLRDKLYLIGIGKEKRILTKILTTAMLLWIVLLLICVVMIVFEIIEMQFCLIFASAMISLTAASIIVAVYQVTSNPVVGVTALFWLSMLMLFLSGGFIPFVFLPAAVKQISVFIPTTPMIDMMKLFFGAAISWPAVVKLLIWSIGFYLVTVFTGGEG